MEDETREVLDRIRQEMARKRLPLAGPLTGRGPSEHMHVKAQRGLSRIWLRWTLAAMGLLALLPSLAPVFAAAGWWSLADPIYTVYLFACHQLPERAAFLFGYQVAYCWRNAAIYGGLFGFGLLYTLSTRSGGHDPGFRLESSRFTHLLARLPKAIPLWAYMLFLAPMALDGFSHMFGLRDGLFYDPSFGSFLVGSQFLSLNWWLRVSTGTLAALGTVWFAFPRLDKYMAMTRANAATYIWTKLYDKSGSWGVDPATAHLSGAAVSGSREGNE